MARLQAHGLEWKFVDDVSVDAYKTDTSLSQSCILPIQPFLAVVFFLARALVESFRKQTQGSNLARNALQRESCRRQLGFLMSTDNARIIGPLRVLMTYFVSEWAELTLTQSKDWQPFLLHWSSWWWHRPVASSKGTHQHTCDPLFGVPPCLYCLNSFTQIQTFIVSCYQGQRWVVKQAKKGPILSISKNWIQIMKFCVNVLPGKRFRQNKSLGQLSLKALQFHCMAYRSSTRHPSAAIKASLAARCLNMSLQLPGFPTLPHDQNNIFFLFIPQHTPLSSYTDKTGVRTIV